MPPVTATARRAAQTPKVNGIPLSKSTAGRRQQSRSVAPSARASRRHRARFGGSSGSSEADEVTAAEEPRDGGATCCSTSPPPRSSEAIPEDGPEFAPETPPVIASEIASAFASGRSSALPPASAGAVCSLSSSILVSPMTETAASAEKMSASIMSRCWITLLPT